MQSIHPETPQGINPGAGFRMPGPLGMCGRQDDGAASGKSCDHRHHFRRWGSVRKDRGFDDGSLRRSQWQLVPAGDTREVELVWDRLFPKQVFSEHPNIASVVHQQDNRYVVSGLRSGNTGLHAANARGICWSELEITVRQPKKILVVFHYVEDKLRKTRRTEGSGGKLLESANEIIAPQTCISFGEKPNPAPVFKIDADLGAFVDPSAVNVKHLWMDRIKKMQLGEFLNVFFVWKISEIAGEPTGGMMLDNLTGFLGDITRRDAGRALAHELGHCLTRSDRNNLYNDPEGHTTDKEYLMERFASGTRISREEADVMYRTAVEEIDAK